MPSSTLLAPRRGLRRSTILLGVALGVSGLAAASPALAADAFFPPTAVPDHYEMVQGATLTVSAGEGVLVNDTFSDAGPLAVHQFQTTAGLSVHPGGDFEYTPDPSFAGVVTFTYIAADQTSHLESGTTTVTITVTPQPNRAPVANPDHYQMVQGGVLHIDAPGVLANDTDADGDALTVAGVQGHDSAEVVLNQSGWLTYTPDAAFTGVTTFQYYADDGHVSSDWTTVTVTVSPRAVSEAPVANPDDYSTPKNTPLVISGPGVLLNDSFPVGTGALGDWVDDAQEVVMAQDGGFTYTPAKDFVGTKTFQYIAYEITGPDSGVSTNWTTVTITVTDHGSTPGPSPTPSVPAEPTGGALAETGGAVNAGVTVGGAALAVLGAAATAFAAWRRRIAG